MGGLGFGSLGVFPELGAGGVGNLGAMGGMGGMDAISTAGLRLGMGGIGVQTFEGLGGRGMAAAPTTLQQPKPTALAPTASSVLRPSQTMPGTVSVSDMSGGQATVQALGRSGLAASGVPSTHGTPSAPIRSSGGPTAGAGGNGGGAAAAVTAGMGISGQDQQDRIKYVVAPEGRGLNILFILQ